LLFSRWHWDALKQGAKDFVAILHADAI
jgi:hypothetical protein